MNENNFLADQFEENRQNLRSVAYRMLGSLSEADDAVQETWLRLTRVDSGEIGNLGGWLRTVVARVSLDMLRSRASRREEILEPESGQSAGSRQSPRDPEEEAVLADTVGLAVLVVLDRLTPAERLAFVMHDMFAVPFEEIAGVVGRSTDAVRQLASRARRRVQGADAVSSGTIAQQREVAGAFVSALRAGDLDGLLKLLDPELVVRVDGASAASGSPVEVRGAANWAKGAITFSRAARFAEPALVDGEVGLVMAPRGRLFRALKLTIVDGRITGIEVIGAPDRLNQLELAVINS